MLAAPHFYEQFTHTKKTDVRYKVWHYHRGDRLSNGGGGSFV